MPGFMRVSLSCRGRGGRECGGDQETATVAAEGEQGLDSASSEADGHRHSKPFWKLMHTYPPSLPSPPLSSPPLLYVLEVPMAKASILWLVGEYCSLVPKISPDVLRKAAKNFLNEVRKSYVKKTDTRVWYIEML